MKEKVKVAFQGEKGAYSHLACLEIFPNADPVSCSTFEEAFQIAKDNSEYKIVIPIENSLAGRVADIHYLIPKYKLQIHAEHFQKINHHLYGFVDGNDRYNVDRWCHDASEIIKKTKVLNHG